MNKNVREADKKFPCKDVDVLKCFCTAVAITFAVKQSFRSSYIELLVLSITTKDRAEV